VSIQFKICVLLFDENWRINTPSPGTVQLIDSVLQVTRKPTLGGIEISKRQFNFNQNHKTY
jgi:hypothetical protein